MPLYRHNDATSALSLDVDHRFLHVRYLSMDLPEGLFSSDQGLAAPPLVRAHLIDQFFP